MTEPVEAGAGPQAVVLARSWIGTPYRHQASVAGVGADCLGLVRGVWRGLYGREPEAVPAYSPDWSEAARDERLWHAAERWLRSINMAARPAEGEVLLFRMRDDAVAKHLGIRARCGANPSFIHAYSGHCVTESALTEAWARRIAARFEFP